MQNLHQDHIPILSLRNLYKRFSFTALCFIPASLSKAYYKNIIISHSSHDLYKFPHKIILQNKEELHAHKNTLSPQENESYEDLYQIFPPIQSPLN